MPTEIAVADVQTFETRGGNTRYVVRDEGTPSSGRPGKFGHRRLWGAAPKGDEQ